MSENNNTKYALEVSYNEFLAIGRAICVALGETDIPLEKYETKLLQKILESIEEELK